MKKLRCGAIGLGRLGLRHALNIAQVPQAQLVAVSDVSQGSLDRFTQYYADVDTYLNYEELLSRDDIDAVVITTSTSTHAEVLRKAIEAKKAIFLEKPISLDVQEARELTALAEKTNSFVQLGFMRRFDTSYAQAKELIDSGAIGSPVSFVGISRDPGAPPLEFIPGSGGIVMDLSVHDLDLARWFLESEVTEVYARAAVVRFEEIGKAGDFDHVDISLTFANGKVGSLESSRNSQYGYDVRTEVVCSDGAVQIGRVHDNGLTVLLPQALEQHPVPGFLERFEKAYAAEIEAFVLDVLANKEPRITLQDGVKAMEIAEAANESLKTNKPVKLR
ncbi:MAG: Gfo/Idh/MocA family protein [Sphaerochaetaceae bacterium]|jgi:scyllo-inositol 2-dehydrogenase (NAD+)